jgi:RimJ/RimL family protein N-acetyltransferase
VNIYTQHLTISRVERDLQPKEVQAIFNSNPDFVRDWEGSEDRSAHTIEEVSWWPLLTGQARENQRFLALKLRESGQLIGIADLLAPHPRGDYAALGLLILHRAWQGKGLGREAAGAIENVLSSEGWREVEVVQRVRLRVAALLGTMRVSVDGRRGRMRMVCRAGFCASDFGWQSEDASVCPMIRSQS